MSIAYNELLIGRLNASAVVAIYRNVEISRSVGLYVVFRSTGAMDGALSSERTLLVLCLVGWLGGCHFQSYSRPIVRPRRKLVYQWMRRLC